MAYRKFSADNIFDGYQMLGEDAVVITNDRGTITDIVQKTEAGENTEVFKGVLTPGLINCHCHLELSFLKGRIAPATGMIPFLLAVMGSRNTDAELVIQEIKHAEQSMFASGIVAVGDICTTTMTVAQKQAQNLFYHNFIEASGFAESSALMRFKQALEVAAHFIDQPYSIVPHAPYSVSPGLFSLINKNKPNSLLTIHNQESMAENNFFQNGQGDFLELYRALGIDITDFNYSTGKTSLQSYLQRISSDHSVIMVHNTITAQEDIDWITSNKSLLPELYWCICPNANWYINKMLPDLTLLMRSGSKIVVGTDSLAANDQLNILEELKTLQKNFTSLSITDLLRWATINGAEALRISDTFGSLEKGKQPGIVLINNIVNNSLENASSKRIL